MPSSLRKRPQRLGTTRVQLNLRRPPANVGPPDSANTGGGGHGQGGQGGGQGGQGGGGQNQPKPPIDATYTPGGTPGQGGPPVPPAAGQNATPPPMLPTSEARRQAAIAAYHNAQVSGNYNLYQAALNYGDPTAMGKYGTAVDNPISALSTIGRQEVTAKDTLSRGRNDLNLFFSGQHIKDQGRLSNEANFERLRALQDYQKREFALQQILAEALASRDSELAMATALELEDFQNKPPEPGAPAGGGGGNGGGPGGGGEGPGGDGSGGGGGGGGSGGPGSGWNPQVPVGMPGNPGSPQHPGPVNVGPFGFGNSGGGGGGGQGQGQGGGQGGGQGQGGGGSNSAQSSSGNRPPRPTQNLPPGWTWVYKAGENRWVKHQMGRG